MSADRRGSNGWSGETRRGSERDGSFRRGEAKRDQRLGAELSGMTLKFHALHENGVKIRAHWQTSCNFVKIMEKLILIQIIKMYE